MNDDLPWLSQLIAGDRESLGLARCCAGLVREGREQLRLLWDDDCGRDMAKRYLDPIEERWEACGSAIESQAAGLAEARRCLEQCSAGASRAIARAQEFAGLLDECHAVDLQIESLRAAAAQRLGEAAACTAAVVDLLDQAEQAAGAA